ncbi:MAG: SRPBCC family protein [bacterium]
MIQFGEEIMADAAPEKIFALYEDVENWKNWDPEVNSSSVSGAFVSGVSGNIKPVKGPGLNIIIESVKHNKSFTVKSKLPLCKIIFNHDLIPVNKDARVIHRVTFIGPFASFFGRIIGGQIRKGLPITLQGLKRAAEENQAINV